MTDYRITPQPGHIGITGHPATLKHVAKWWAWHPVYLVVFILATLGSLIFGFVPGWGGVVAAICTIIAAFTGFKAGARYIRETIR